MLSRSMLSRRAFINLGAAATLSATMIISPLEALASDIEIFRRGAFSWLIQKYSSKVVGQYSMEERTLAYTRRSIAKTLASEWKTLDQSLFEATNDIRMAKPHGYLFNQREKMYSDLAVTVLMLKAQEICNKVPTYNLPKDVKSFLREYIPKQQPAKFANRTVRQALREYQNDFPGEFIELYIGKKIPRLKLVKPEAQNLL